MPLLWEKESKASEPCLGGSKKLPWKDFLQFVSMNMFGECWVANDQALFRSRDHHHPSFFHSLNYLQDHVVSYASIYFRDSCLIDAMAHHTVDSYSIALSMFNFDEAVNMYTLD